MSGSIQHRPDRPSPWRARYRTPRGRQASKSFKRKVDAERWLRDQLSSMDTGQWIDPKRGNVTFGAVAERWHDARTNRRPSTRARDRSMLDSQILPHLGETPVKHLRPSDLQAWIATLEQDYTPATVRKAWQIASGVLSSRSGTASSPRLPPERSTSRRRAG